MYLADTSAWINAQKQPPAGKGALLKRLLAAGSPPVGVTGVIIQEVLQGARDEAAFVRLQRYMESRPRYESTAPETLHARAAHLYARCRWQGQTPRKSTDCLIACIALEHDLTLLHDDRDFEAIAMIEPRLKLA